MSAVHELEHDRSGRGGHTGSGRAAPRLVPVPDAVQPLRRLPFAVVLVGVLGIGLLGLLVLNTQLQDQSFKLSELEARSTRLAYTEDALQHELDQVSSPASLVAKATALGMRPYVGPGFITMPDGTVVGSPEKATGKDFKSSLIKSPAQIEAEKRAVEEKRRAEQARKDAEKRRAEAEQKKAEQEKAEQKKAEQEKKKAEQDEEGE